MITKQMILVSFIFLSACSSQNITDTDKTTRTLNQDVKTLEQNWEKEIVSQYDQQFPDIYTYQIKWNKGDSVVTYRVLSKFKDTLVPIELEHLTIKAESALIEVDFRNKLYIHNLPKFTQDFSDIDKSKVSSMYGNMGSIYITDDIEERKTLMDSIANILFR